VFRFLVIDSRARRAVRCATLSLIVACSDSTAPTARSGLFRLTTVNSLSLPFFCPPSSFSGPCEIRGGELLLRPDATFTIGVDGIALINFDGTYVRGRDSLTFTVPNGDPSKPPLEFSVAAGGDSVRLDVSPPPMAMLFRSSPMPAASIVSASYVLTEANGRTGQPLVLSDTVISGTRYVYRVHFDSLWLKDGLFFKQHRAESSTAYLARGDSLNGSDEAISVGSFTSVGGWVVLRRYWSGTPTLASTDSLAIATGTLTRTTRLRAGNRVERYSRIR
jgi:hypothetical protein